MIYTGDCLDVLPTLDAESVDAIVTDPPYDLLSASRHGSRRINVGQPGNPYAGGGARAGGFMGKAWDATGVAFNPETWREALRVAKPGAHLLAFGGTRTYHRLACAIEDAGWEIRDCLVWAYASGFPKSLDVSKAIDKAAGVERPIVRERDWHDPMDTPFRKHYGGEGPEGQPVVTVTGPATPEAAKWQGWGTALKPAWEPIILARKPLRGTVAANVERYGTGALNIDGTRIPAEPYAYPNGPKGNVDPTSIALGRIETRVELNALGRWPANVVLTDPIFDGDMPGVVGGGGTASGVGTIGHGNGPSETHGWGGTIKSSFGDSGTYSRFFSIPVTMGVCRYCGVPIADGSSTASPTPATPSGTAPEPASSPRSLSPSEPALSAAAPSGDPGGSIARPNAALWDAEGSASSWDSPDTSGTAKRSSNGSEPTTPPIPRNRQRATSPASASRPDPAKSVAPSETSSATTTTTRDRLMCDTCAALATAGYTPDATPTGRRVSREVPADSPDHVRFLLIPKASRADREPVLGGLEERDPAEALGATARLSDPRMDRPQIRRMRANVHPTVKPLDLMRHLVRLVTPPGGVVLDPFLGSGSTALAAELEGFAWIGIEKEAEYVAIAEARLNGTQRGMAL